jgi:uroporphyrinogen-III synthase
MQQNKINILSTSPLEQSLIANAAIKNIFIENISFIETKIIDNDLLNERILHLAHHQLTVIFTSKNAVEAITKHLQNIKPNWRIFCVGSITNNLVKKYFDESSIAGTADSASALADVIISKENVPAIIFFCGDKRRNELPDKLKQHNIEVNEIEVYKTFETPHAVAKYYNAIFFYSPSAVTSFFSLNKINEQTILFAIGSTTANEIKKHSDNKIIIGEESSKELLVLQAINYFKTNPIHL